MVRARRKIAVGRAQCHVADHATDNPAQIVSAGLTEEQALAAGHDCDCRVLSAPDIPRALANRDIRSALKLMADADNGKVLGVHAAIEVAGDVMLAVTYAIKLGMTVDDIADTWAPYLTVSEALRIAAGAVPQRQADQLLRMTRDRSRRGRCSRCPSCAAPDTSY